MNVKKVNKRVQGSGFRVQGSGFRVQGSGLWIIGSPVLLSNFDCLYWQA
jgi:hypothetical protein